MRFFAFIVFIFLFPCKGFSTHVIGGDLHYDQVGNSTSYNVSLNLYKDCQPFYTPDSNLVTPIGFDNIQGQPPVSPGLPFAFLSIYYYHNGSLDSTIAHFTTLDIDTVEILDPDTCLTEPMDLCVLRGRYTIQVELPDTTDDGYYLSYQKCCRNPSNLNVEVDPFITGSSFTAFVPKLSDVPENSNPKFLSPPPLAFCLDRGLIFSNLASDSDGDSLVYSFGTPLLGTNGTSTNPIAPPYENISYQPGYSFDQPIPSNPQFTIDPQTSLLEGTPNQLGPYILGIKVQEYRNGVLLSETIRDIRLYVVDCGNIGAFFDLEDHICETSDDIEFSTSSDAEHIFWDFGDPNTSTDTSSNTNTSYTYTNNGTYTVSLTTKNGQKCIDSVSHSFEFRNSIYFDVNQIEKKCFSDNEYSFYLNNTDFVSGTTVNWELGTAANISQATGDSVVNVSFSEAGIHTINVVASYEQCSYEESFTVEVYPEIIAEFPPDTILCTRQEYLLQMQPNNPNYSYNWEINGQQFTNSTVSLNIDTSSQLDISVEVIDQYGCASYYSDNQLIEVKPLPIADFEVSSTSIELGEQIEVSNLAQFYEELSYNMGDGTSIEEEDFEYEFDDIGFYTIAQEVSNGGNCPDYKFIQIEVKSAYSIYFPNVFSPNGNGINDTFFPITRNIKAYSLVLTNRWGEIVYNGIEFLPFHEWNGSYLDGELADEEVYNYFCVYQTKTGELHSKQGYALLIK
ncbi:MAG: PKD domain-containing protein [Flavobacteriales bacterium]